MNRRLRCWLAAVAVAAAGLPVRADPQAPREVQFPSLDGTTLTAWVQLPAQRPKATVIALHGCGGLYARRSSDRSQLSARHRAMAELLVGQGYAVVFPDSLSPRDQVELCTQPFATRSVGQMARRADALAALSWVAAQPWAQPDRIALLGWSHGGSTVLAATDLTRTPVRHARVRPALAVAFYPGCSAALHSGYRPSTTLVLMLAELDDWTPAKPCIELGHAVGAEVNVYAGSYHAFDNPRGQVRLLPDVPNGVNPGVGVHAGANPAAREQAYARLGALLRQAFP